MSPKHKRGRQVLLLENERLKTKVKTLEEQLVAIDAALVAGMRPEDRELLEFVLMSPHNGEAQIPADAWTIGGRWIAALDRLVLQARRARLIVYSAAVDAATQIISNELAEKIYG